MLQNSMEVIHTNMSLVSSNSPSPGKPISEGQRFRYQVTVNESFKPNEGEENKAPPVLPPRNYRTNMHSRSHSEDQTATVNPELRHARPFMPPPPSSQEPKRNTNFDNDFGSTPKPDLYAAQLRQMAKKQQESLMAARFQHKPVPETKTSISVSRPVEKQPVPQEAKPPPEVQETRQPQPIYRSLQIAKDMNLVGLSSDTKHLDPAEPVTGESVPVQSENKSPKYIGSQGPEPQVPPSTLPPVQISQSFPVSKHQVVQSVMVPYGARQQSHILQSGMKNPPPLPTHNNQTEAPPPPLPERRIGFDQPRDFSREIPNHSQLDPELTNITDYPQNNLQEHAETPNRYSSESYLYNKGTVRQGFGGNYKRNDSSPTFPPTTLAFTHNNNTHAQGAPSSPLGSVNPPEMQTMVQVPTVLTSSGHQMESPENHTVLKPGPKLNMELNDRQAQEAMNTSYQEPMNSSYQEPVQNARQNNMKPYYGEETPKRAPSVPRIEESGVVYQESPGVKVHIAQLEYKDTTPNVSERSMGISRSKVAELRDTLIRRSNENLADEKYCDRSPRRSPQRSPHRSLENLSDTSSHFYRKRSQEDVSKGIENMNISSGRFNDHVYEHENHQRFPHSSAGKTVFDSREPILYPHHHPQPVEQPKNEESVTYIPRVSSYEEMASPQPMSANTYGAKSIDTASTNQKETSGETRPASHHVRQKSQEEIECEQQAAILALQVKEIEPELSEAILPPPDHKTTNDFMSGIFDTKVNLKRRPSLLQKYQTPEREKQRLERRKTMELKRQEMQLPHNSPYWSPPSIASLQNKMRQQNLSTEELLKDMGGINTSLDRQKEELVHRIQKKIDILKDEKGMLNDEIEENNTLGKEVTLLVESKSTNDGELKKYKLYVVELEKVMNLLLNISGRLARAENAIMSLTEDSSESEKTTLTTKRNELQSKHEDARMLKDGIDRRSKQVSINLKKILDEEEFADYEYFIKMKSKLNMEHQEIDDKIKLGEEQLSALKSSMSGL